MGRLRHREVKECLWSHRAGWRLSKDWKPVRANGYTLPTLLAATEVPPGVTVISKSALAEGHMLLRGGEA